MFMMTLISSVVSMMIDDRRQRTLSWHVHGTSACLSDCFRQFSGQLWWSARLQVIIVLCAEPVCAPLRLRSSFITALPYSDGLMLVSLGVAARSPG